MTDSTARDQVRQWLAHVLHDADPCPCRCTGEAVCRWPQMYTALADAILDAPGVTVTTLAHPGSDTTRTAILMPAQKIGEPS